MSIEDGFPHKDMMTELLWDDAEETKLTKANGDIHEDYKDGISELSDVLRRLMRRAELPHSIQDHMGTNGHTDATMIEMRWDTEQAMRKHAVVWLNISKWPDKYKMKYSLVMMQLLRMTKSIKDSPFDTPPRPVRGRGHSSQQIDTLQDADRRRRVEVAWQRFTPQIPFPRMPRQPSDQLLKLMFPIFEAGKIPELDWNDLTAALADLAMTETDWTTKEIVDGEYVKTDKKKARVPQTTREWERAMELHDNAMLMGVNCHRTNSKLDMDYDKLNEWQNHFRGPAILLRQPEPPIWLLRDIFRNAWGHVAHRMQEHSEAMTEAMDAIYNNQMFWSMHFTEIYQKWEQSDRGKGKGKQRTGGFAKRMSRGNGRDSQYKGKESYKGNGKRKAKDDGNSRYPQQRQGKGKADKGFGKRKGAGKGKKGGKGKDKNKGGKDNKRKNDLKPDYFCSKDKGGTLYCMDFHVRNSCKDWNCWKSHNCPVWAQSKNGPCNAPPSAHKPWACPHAPGKKGW